MDGHGVAGKGKEDGFACIMAYESLVLGTLVYILCIYLGHRCIAQHLHSGGHLFHVKCYGLANIYYSSCMLLCLVRLGSHHVRGGVRETGWEELNSRGA